MWEQFPAIREYKILRLEAFLGTNFCDYNRDFYKKLSLESVPLAEKAREKHFHSFHQAQKKSLRMLSILQRLLGDLPVVLQNWYIRTQVLKEHLATIIGEGFAGLFDNLNSRER